MTWKDGFLFLPFLVPTEMNSWRELWPFCHPTEMRAENWICYGVNINLLFNVKKWKFHSLKNSLQKNKKSITKSEFQSKKCLYSSHLALVKFHSSKWNLWVVFSLLCNRFFLREIFTLLHFKSITNLNDPEHEWQITLLMDYMLIVVFLSCLSKSRFF